ncbi:integrase-like protein [Breoghania corrubedonensis]|uniref:Integrase-like protein n=1 Tax=Breoghania corrubedonensis TaxID=665038 RepID=A0A2T5VD70_9HYPH|nr:phage integrase N-terminal domain-containing protein [Breoghania corrubedonensis]PTW61685.1 integrase-like protein [Breoghania corrubedonensis]
MDDLTMDLVRLCHRNRDGSYGTQTNRRRGLTAMAKELSDFGYRLPAAASLKPKHVDALVERWLDEDKSDASIRNRLTWLRWWAEKINKPNVVHRENSHYGVAEHGEVQRNRAKTFDPRKFQSLECPYVKASVLLQVAFGLRREEAMKFQPQKAMRGDHIALQASWTKGGRARTVPITTSHQREVLYRITTFIKGRGSLIPPSLSYVEQMKRYEYQTHKAGYRNIHGFRHTYAQQRYLTLTGFPCPLAGGKAWKDMTEQERAADRAARRQVSAELGHARLKITDTYLGSAFR